MDTKTCTRCNAEKGLHNFRTKAKTYPDGKVFRYHDSNCNACRSEMDAIRYQRKKTGEVLRVGRPPKGEAEPLWHRPASELACDAALMGWRAVDRRVAFQGPRL
jgi:hypothetical protein